MPSVTAAPFSSSSPTALGEFQFIIFPARTIRSPPPSRKSTLSCAVPDLPGRSHAYATVRLVQGPGRKVLHRAMVWRRRFICDPGGISHFPNARF